MTDVHRLQEMVDKAIVAELLHTERACRDRGDWDGLRKVYHPDGVFRAGWFDGGIEAYIEASKATLAANDGGQHLTFPPIVTLHGDRAIAEANLMLLGRGELHGVDVDTTGYMRWFLRCERRDDWGICSVDAVYIKTALAPVLPGDVPPIDRRLLAAQPPAYSYLAYQLVQMGYPVTEAPTSVGDAAAMTAFYTAAKEWLVGKR